MSTHVSNERPSAVTIPDPDTSPWAPNYWPSHACADFVAIVFTLSQVLVHAAFNSGSRSSGRQAWRKSSTPIAMITLSKCVPRLTSLSGFLRRFRSGPGRPASIQICRARPC